MSNLTVIMPVWNQLEYTKQAIKSLLEHTTRSEFSLIVVDNGSETETAVWLNEQLLLGNIDNLIRFETNKGWIVACNEGIKLDKKTHDSRLVLFANNDIVFQSGWLGNMCAALARKPEYGAVGPTSNYVAGIQSIQYNMNGVRYEETKLLIGFCLMLKKEVLNKIGLMDESFGLGGGDDLDYSIRIREAGYKMIIDRTTYIHHYGSKTIAVLCNDDSDKYREYHEDKDRQIIAKWGPAKYNEIITMPKRLTIAGAIPMSSDMVHRHFARSLVMLQKPGNWKHVDCPRINVAEARNLLADYALKQNCTHILFIDDDMTFPQDACIRLLDHDKDIISGLAFKRREDYSPCIYNVIDGTLTTITDKIKKGLIEVDACGAAFLLVKMEVFEALTLPYFVWGDKSLGIHEADGGVGEDISFCLRAKKAGFKVFVDTDLIIKHIGDNNIVDDATYLEFTQTKKASMRY